MGLKRFTPQFTRFIMTSKRMKFNSFVKSRQDMKILNEDAFIASQFGNQLVNQVELPV